jgi:hypothetical protein
VQRQRSPRPRAAIAVNPTKACLQLQNFGLHNTGQGIAKLFQAQLTAETASTPIGTDVIQWLNDLAAPVPGTSSGAEQLLNQIIADAGAVSADCAGYGIRNVLGG